MDKKFKQCCKLLGLVITDIAGNLVNMGWTFTETDRDCSCEDTLLKPMRHIDVSTIGSDTYILGKDINTLNRFWHDVTHRALHKGFSYDDECIVIATQELQLSAYLKMHKIPLEIQVDIMDIFHNDMRGQTEYYKKYGEFVKDQTLFVKQAYRYGLEFALASKC